MSQSSTGLVGFERLKMRKSQPLAFEVFEQVPAAEPTPT
jgi:hypothetical protein